MWGKSNHSRACGLTAANKLLATHGLSITVFQQKTKSLNKWTQWHFFRLLVLCCFPPSYWSFAHIYICSCFLWMCVCVCVWMCLCVFLFLFGFLKRVRGREPKVRWVGMLGVGRIREKLGDGKTWSKYICRKNFNKKAFSWWINTSLNPVVLANCICLS